MHASLCQGWTIEVQDETCKVWNGRKLVAVLKDTSTSPRVIWGRLSEVMLPLVARKIKETRSEPSEGAAQAAFERT